MNEWSYSDYLYRMEWLISVDRTKLHGHLDSRHKMVQSPRSAAHNYAIIHNYVSEMVAINHNWLCKNEAIHPEALNPPFFAENKIKTQPKEWKCEPVCVYGPRHLIHWGHAARKKPFAAERKRAACFLTEHQRGSYSRRLQPRSLKPTLLY